MTDIAAKFEPLQFRIGPTKSLHGRKKTMKERKGVQTKGHSPRWFFRELEKCYNCATRAAWNFPDLLSFLSPSSLPPPVLHDVTWRVSDSGFHSPHVELKGHQFIEGYSKGLQEVAITTLRPYLKAGKDFNSCCCVILQNGLQEGFCRVHHCYLLT